MSESTQMQLILRTLRELRPRYGAPRAWRYWLDFTLSVALLWGAFFVTATATTPGRAALFFALTCLAAFRVSVFVHELNHAGARVRGLRLAYNLCFGFPFKLPAYLFADHKFHHQTGTFGTEHDPKYEDFARQDRGRLLLVIPATLELVAKLTLRFAVLPPLLPFLSVATRRWWFTRGSGAPVNRFYRQTPPGEEEMRRARPEDLATFATFWGIVALCGLGVLPWTVPALLLAALFMIWILDFVHLLSAHGYASLTGAASLQAQAEDSTTIVGSWWTELWNPLGLRYHALHHLQESLPYHSLGPVHRELARRLPADHFYLRTVRPSALPVWRGLFARMGARRV